MAVVLVASLSVVVLGVVPVGPASAEPLRPLRNESFTDQTGWSQYSREGRNLIHSFGDGEASLCDTRSNDCDDRLTQGFVVPRHVDNARLTFFARASSNEDAASCNDTLFVGLTTAAGVAIPGASFPLCPRDLLSYPGSRFEHDISAAMRQHTGEALRVQVSATGDDVNPSLFEVDEVVLIIAEPAIPTDVFAYATGPGAATVVWRAPAGGGAYDSFEVGGNDNSIGFRTVGRDVRSVSFTGLTMGTSNLRIGIATRNSVGVSQPPLAWSNYFRADVGEPVRELESDRQYQLTGSNGVNWTPIDSTNLVLRYNATADGSAVVDANADLWTAAAGVNQDLGIFVSTDGGTPQLAAWKESGGSAGTYSPNAASVVFALPVAAGHGYAFTLAWKSNKAATGKTIFAGAGPNGFRFSPTRLGLRFVQPAADQRVVGRSTRDQQHLTASDGKTWVPLGGGALRYVVDPTADAELLLSANADLWSGAAGINQDLGIRMKVGSGQATVLAWKESGGFAGTYSPNAAVVHTAVHLTAGMHYEFEAVWKANKATGSRDTIYAGAGSGAAGGASPSTLVAVTSPSGSASHTALTTQPILTNSDGVTWQRIEGTTTQPLTAPSGGWFLVTGSADLWTETPGFNQDLGIVGTASDQGVDRVVWKESGGAGGTYSPNATAFRVLIPVNQPGETRSFTLTWKTNKPGVSRIHAGAGPIGGAYSPSSVTVQFIPGQIWAPHGV